MKYLIPASYEASMSLNNEVLTEKLKNENSPEFLQLSRDTCGKVCTLRLTGLRDVLTYPCIECSVGVPMTITLSSSLGVQ